MSKEFVIWSATMVVGLRSAAPSTCRWFPAPLSRLDRSASESLPDDSAAGREKSSPAP
jgi:hypothetical protein